MEAEQRLLATGSIFGVVMPPFVLVMSLYVAFTRDNGQTVWPWSR